MRIAFACVALLVLTLLISGRGFAEMAESRPNLQVRLDALEAETAALRTELEQCRAELVRLPQVAPQIPPGANNDRKTSGETPSEPDEDFYSLEELQTEMKKFAWKKGDFKIVPYGRITVDVIYETERSTEGDLILWVDSPDVHGEDAFYIDAKSTRFGLAIEGPGIACCPGTQVGGCIEFDFQGQYLYRNKPGLLFRQAYVEVKDEEFRLLAGQTWEVISPLYPGNLNYVPGSGVGNLGYRRAQVRADRYMAFSDRSLLTLQSSLNMGIELDFVRDTTVVGGTAGWPVFEGRAAWKIGRRKGPDSLPVEIGLSGHIGEEIYDFLSPNPNPADDVPRRTWSLNLDLDLPITRRLGFRAEFFTGENLSAYMGGILQGVDKTTRRGIRSIGGWFDVRYDWTPRFRSYAGYSIDDPFNQDLTSGRIYNHFFFVNFLYDVTDKFMIGLDVSSWKTHWIDKRPGESVRFQFQTQYHF